MADEDTKRCVKIANFSKHIRNNIAKSHSIIDQFLVWYNMRDIALYKSISF